MIGAHLFSSRGYNHALVYEFLFNNEVEVFINLLVINESQITVFFYVTRSYAIHGIYGAALKLVKVA